MGMVAEMVERMYLLMEVGVMFGKLFGRNCADSLAELGSLILPTSERWFILKFQESVLLWYVTWSLITFKSSVGSWW